MGGAMHRFAALFIVALFLSFLPASGHAAANPDQATIRAYTLSMDKLNRFATAVEAFEKAAETDDTLPAEREAVEDAGDTLAEKRATYAQHPKVMAFFQAQGLSVDDIVVGLQAALDYPEDKVGVPGTGGDQGPAEARVSDVSAFFFQVNDADYEIAVTANTAPEASQCQRRRSTTSSFHSCAARKNAGYHFSPLPTDHHAADQRRRPRRQAA